MRKIFIGSSLLVSYLLFAAYAAIACDCAAKQTFDAFESAEAVFIGKVTDTGGLVNPYVDFTVEKSWKSADTDELSINVTGCDIMSFKTNQRYLVYAYEDAGSLYTGSCTRTRILSDAEEDLNYLNDKNSIPVTKKTFFTRNIKTVLMTGTFVLIFLAIGSLIITFKRR